jgi:uncharacterized metal-binding protein
MKHSDGFYHDRITLVLAPLSALACAITFSALGLAWPLAAVLALAGGLAALFVNPDLDQVGVSSAEMNVTRVPLVGWLLGALWIGFWFPYAGLVQSVRAFGRRGHRSPLSHWPLIGTAGRLAYIAAAYLLADGVLMITLSPVRLPPLAAYPLEALAAVAALALADVGHWVRDVLTTKGR